LESNTQNRTIALAAIFQCVDGVSQIATTGSINEAVFNTAINSILNDSADSAAELYGSLGDLKPGISSLIVQLSTTPTEGQAKDLEATRYALGLLQLEKKLSNNQEMFRELLSGIEDTQRKLEFFDSEHENITAALAELYASTVSKLGPKIMVKGEQTHLANPKNAAKIRTLLLAGIRASLLWRQAGGTRWKLLFERGKLQRQASEFLKQI